MDERVKRMADLWVAYMRSPRTSPDEYPGLRSAIEDVVGIVYPKGYDENLDPNKIGVAYDD